jgi:hypothetical protein
MKTVLFERTTYCRRTRTLITTRVEVVPGKAVPIAEHVELTYQPIAPPRKPEDRRG